MERRWWGAGLAGREHCMGSPASNGATCEHCMGPPASNGGQQRRWRGEHQGRKESCRPPNQDWVTPRERKAVLDRPKPPCWSPTSSCPSSLASWKTSPMRTFLAEKAASPPGQPTKAGEAASPHGQPTKAGRQGSRGAAPQKGIKLWTHNSRTIQIHNSNKYQGRYLNGGFEL